MKHRVLGLLAAGLAAASFAAMPAVAADNHHGGNHGAHHGGGRPGHHADGGAHRPRPPHHGGVGHHRPITHHGRHRPLVRPGHAWRAGGVAAHHWAKGQRFNRRYAHNYAHIYNWRRYRGLYAPPRGYYWARSGNDAVLVALGTGIIAAVIASSIH